MAQRTVARIVSGLPAVDGAGVHMVRVLGSSTVTDFDPFLMLDAFDSRNPRDYIRGFPMHPHRGIETFTYLALGEIDHQDSLGNQGRITDGACQWMTAGGGILHQEMPQPSERLLGLQLWINLPAVQKMVPPKYRDLTPQNIPRLEENGATVSVVTGTYNGVQGATRGDYVDVRFLDLELRPDARWMVETDPEETVFAYTMEGSCSFQDGVPPFPARRAYLLSSGDRVFLRAGREGARLVLVSGRPLREPVAWGGPIVMNTHEELEQAFFELGQGTFIRHR